MAEKLVVSSSPHIKTPETVDVIMRDVLLALIPPFVVSLWLFGVQSLYMVIVAVLVAMFSEALLIHRSISFEKIKGDWSAAVTGVIFGLSLPPATPWWIVAVGSFVAIAVGKQLFGGLGYNIFNPALVGRAFVVVSWPADLTHWTPPFEHIDATSTATPLAIAADYVGEGFIDAFSRYDLFIGTVPGSVGETSVLAILIGGVYLAYRGHIDIRVPLGYMAAVAAVALISGSDVIYHLMSGSALFAAVFMATCMVTSPLTKKGKLIFGIGCGFFTVIFRLFGEAPEGVTYAILLMNALVPFINKYTVPKVYGEVSE